MDKQRKLQKLAKLQAIMEKGNPEIARFLFALEDNIDNVSSEINTLIQSLAEQNSQSLNELRQDFEDIKPTDERLAEIIKPLIPEVVDGETPSKEDLLAIIEPLIPKVKNGETPSKADLLELIKPLIPTIDEDEIVGRIVAIVESNIKLPSVEVIAEEIEKKVELNLPKFGKPIRDSLELLKGKNRLDKDAIRGLENYDDLVDLAKKEKKIVNKYYNTSGRDPRITTNRPISDDYEVTSADEIIICDSVSPIEITMLPATGSGQKYIVKNVNTGFVIIRTNNPDTIDSKPTQSINQWDSIQLVDYAVNKWIII